MEYAEIRCDPQAEKRILDHIDYVLLKVELGEWFDEHYEFEHDWASYEIHFDIVTLRKDIDTLPVPALTGIHLRLSRSPEDSVEDVEYIGRITEKKEIFWAWSHRMRYPQVESNDYDGEVNLSHVS